MIFFNDPLPCPDPAARAVKMAVAMRGRIQELAAGWSKLGHNLALAIGIAQGYATLGRIGFEGRFDYAAIGSVTNLAARLCGEAARWTILVTQRVHGDIDDIVVSDSLGDLTLRGFSKPIRAFEIKGLDAARAASP